MNAQSPRHLAYADAMRVVAMVAVVALHVSAVLVKQHGAIAQWEWLAGVTVNAATRWCVPLFVMVSGALLLDPARAEPFPRFVARRFLRVGVPLVAWSAAYFAWAALFHGVALSPAGMLAALWRGTPYYHLWFLFMLAGLYLVTPALRRLVAGLERRQVAVVAGVCLGAASLAQSGAALLGDGLHLAAPLMFLPYVGFYLAGYVLRAPWTAPAGLRLARLAVPLCVTAVAAGMAVLLPRFGQNPRGMWMAAVFNPVVIVMTLAVFIVLAASRRQGRSWPARLAPATLGVYLVHPMVLDVLVRAGLVPSWGSVWVGLPLTLAVTLVASWAAAMLLWRVPVLRWTVGAGR